MLFRDHFIVQYFDHFSTLTLLKNKKNPHTKKKKKIIVCNIFIV